MLRDRALADLRRSYDLWHKRERCGDECEQHGEHGMEPRRVCAQACRRCERACEELLAATKQSLRRLAGTLMRHRRGGAAGSPADHAR